MKEMTVGQLARASGVHVETIRYYERRGLLAKSSRTESGYRKFSEDTIKRIQFIKGAQQVGFTLKEIQGLLSLRVDPKTSCSDVKKRAEIKIKEIESKVFELQKMKRSLQKLKASCKGRGPTSDCPILDAFDRRGVQER